MDEWEALPWWVQRTYVDGMRAELGAGQPAGPAGDPDDLSDLAELGVIVERSGL